MITEHAISALPAGHRDWYHLVIRVQRRSSSDRWMLRWGGLLLDGDGFNAASPTYAADFDEATALRLAEQWAVQITLPDGRTAADLINR